MPSKHYRFYLTLTVLCASLGLLLFTFHDEISDIKSLKHLQELAENRLGKPRKTALELDPPPTERPYGAVVIASGADPDSKWAGTIEANWTIYEYDIRRPNHEDPRLRFPASKGHEAMIYLSFIVDNYDNLPWASIFIHGHLDAWHQEDKADRLIDGLNRVELARQGYISLRCDWYPSCPAEIRPVHHDAIVWGADYQTKGTEAAIAGNWRLLFPDEKLPETIASPCCAQFAVTRQAIIKRPREDYERMRRWLLHSLLEDELSGRVMEKLWAYIFTGEAVHCPPPQQCACEWFGRCEDQQFAKPPKGVAPLPDWPSSFRA